MALEMRTECERCGVAVALDGDARICSHECTFCVSCTGEIHGICPNCSGELVPRPKRVGP